MYLITILGLVVSVSSAWSMSIYEGVRCAGKLISTESDLDEGPCYTIDGPARYHIWSMKFNTTDSQVAFEIWTGSNCNGALWGHIKDDYCLMSNWKSYRVVKV
ncbi:hypothetical protein FE257_001601 [Aspergillus nanangensis]|uniref:Uncharacterized protein n=1 Tax=Aspergillus nanangensis TaxID=2582783 RepID=A0AAD4CU27_ASPNN|nr:hypothetical protein FE257_001601 [Aspergillus nanangensis]